MSKINDGGTAFPILCEDGIVEPGMKLRDWLAGQALTTVATGSYSLEATARLHNIKPQEALAKIAVEIADALIAELEEGSKQ